jgi:hypothetical protein
MKTPLKVVTTQIASGRTIPGGIQVTRILSKAATALQKKYDQLGGEATFGKVPDAPSLQRVWDFGTQCLFYNSKHDEAFQIKGVIYEKWKALGANWVPNTDELPTPDGVGRFNHFTDDTASIYWTPQTGANAIYGDIRKRWSELGWERSYLGYPTSDESDIDEGGRANSFQSGWIYWWSDTGAIDLRDVVVNYVGFYAYKESDHDQSSGSDEPYCIFTVVAPKQDPVTSSTKVYSGVDDQSARPDRMELYRGPAYGLRIGVVGMENDKGDPEKSRQIIQTAVKTNHEIGKFMLQFIPLVGPIISKIAGPALDGLMPKIADGIASILDLGDDLIGSVSVPLSTKKLVTLATRGSVTDLKGIKYKIGSPTMAQGGARYAAFFSVDPA